MATTTTSTESGPTFKTAAAVANMIGPSIQDIRPFDLNNEEKKRKNYFSSPGG
jgi:hypothetical protein